MTAIHIQNVFKAFAERGKKRGADVMALKDVSLEIASGELFALLGPSGCGKSTLLNIIAGLERPTSGDLLFGEARVNELPAQDRDVGMVFQSYALYPHMTVRDNIGFPLRLRGVGKDKADSEVESIAKSVSVAELLNRRPRELSGGQRQRVALARALVRHPRVLLMDEPLSNLDAALRLEMRSFIRRLHEQRRTTTVYVTHDQEEAMAIADCMAVLNKGQLEQTGRPSEVYLRPANLWTARFVGVPPINIFEPAKVKLLKVPAAVPAGGGAVGVRPHLLSLESKGGDELVLEGTVEGFEDAGDRIWVWLKSQEIRVRAVSSRENRPQAGKTAAAYAAARDILVFDAKSGGAVYQGLKAAS